MLKSVLTQPKCWPSSAKYWRNSTKIFIYKSLDSTESPKKHCLCSWAITIIFWTRLYGSFSQKAKFRRNQPLVKLLLLLVLVMMRKIKVTHFLRVIRLRKKHHIYSGNMVATPCQEVPAKAMLFHMNDKHSLRKSSKRQAMINVLLNDVSGRNVGFGFVHRFARCWSCSRLVTYSMLLRWLFAIKDQWKKVCSLQTHNQA